jgi:hypothetical protein
LCGFSATLASYLEIAGALVLGPRMASYIFGSSPNFEARAIFASVFSFARLEAALGEGVVFPAPNLARLSGPIKEAER